MRTPELDVAVIMPMIIVATAAMVLPLLEVLLARMIVRKRTWLSRPMTRELAGTMMAFVTAASLGIALLFTVGIGAAPDRHFNPDRQMIVIDGMTVFLTVILLAAAIMTVLVSIRYLADLRNNRGEYYALMLASVLGMMLLTAATDLLMIFLALELMTIPVYALAGYQRRSLRSNESAVKYFITGSFAAALLLYGSALLYGATGSLSLPEIGARFDPQSPLAVIGAGLVLIGLAFKIGSVPFHQWAPDVYEGAPTTVTAFMATAVKVAAFGALLRVLIVALEPIQDEKLFVPLWWMAVLSMTVGNVMAIVQQNIKRMLAYSSIAHAGYLLVGVCVGTQAGYSAVLFYLAVYTFMSIAAFAVVAALARDGEDRAEVDRLSGLYATRPFLAAVMAIAMFALAGIPGTGGFMGKYQLFSSAVEQWTRTGDQSLLWLAIIGVLNSAISLYYYLRVPVVMYMRSPVPGEQEVPAYSFFGGLVLATCALAILLLGIVPQSVGVLWDVDALRSAAEAVADVSGPTS
jgi:NADH-quinone oxidoreductase subunit N